jgi:hypothetical protein
LAALTQHSYEYVALKTKNAYTGIFTPHQSYFCRLLLPVKELSALGVLSASELVTTFFLMPEQTLVWLLLR